MAKVPPIYRRLTGGFDSFRLRRSKRLYAAADHLLSVSALYGIETYRRFFLRDIRALVVRRTPAGRVRAIIFGTLGLMALAGGVLLLRQAGPGASSGTPEFVFACILFGLAALLLLAVLVDLLLGPTCAVYVQTLAGTEPLGTPARWRGAVKLQARLDPLIRAVQAPEAPAP